MAEEKELKEGMFGKIGEHMVGYELSKRGWIIFFPPYDERIDVIAVKFRCKKCKSLWINEHRIACSNSSCKEYGKAVRVSDKIKGKKCNNCGFVQRRAKGNSQVSLCPHCKKGELEEVALCPVCDSEIEVLKKNCSNPTCDSTKYEVVYRSIQVKSSHLVDNGKNIGFNFKHQDIFNSPDHFLVVYNSEVVNDIEMHTYWLLSIADFMSIKNINTTSYKIYQNDRGHYNPKKLEPFRFNEQKYYQLQEKLRQAKDDKEKQRIIAELQKVDVFKKLD